MPYSSSHNNASSDLRAAIIATFFEDAPCVPAATTRPETPIVLRCVVPRSGFCSSQDQGETALPEEDSSSAAEGEVHSTYGTPEGSPQSTFSFYLELDDFPADHRSHRGGGNYQTGGATVAAEVWGENHNWGIR
jgi:hypothetical protein